ncbi:MAG: sulfotransferase, partial [Halobacteria archaeon]|nr:sulfotransferase [Halobacteria archaeon]
MSQSQMGIEKETESASEKQPIFLLSTERSGSNLVRSILNTHPDISAPHPLETAYPWKKVVSPHEMSERKARKILRDTVINKNYSFHPLEVTIDVDNLYERWTEQKQHSLLSIQNALYFESAEQEDNSAWVSKYPALWDCLDDIMEYYPNPKFVYLVRDARDVVLSFKRSNVGRYHPYYNAKRWQEEQERGIEFLGEHKDAVHVLQYKKLLQDPESVVKSMCESLDIEYDQRMLYYYETEEAKAAS